MLSASGAFNSRALANAASVDDRPRCATEASHPTGFVDARSRPSEPSGVPLRRHLSRLCSRSLSPSDGFRRPGRRDQRGAVRRREEARRRRDGPVAVRRGPRPLRRGPRALPQRGAPLQPGPRARASQLLRPRGARLRTIRGGGASRVACAHAAAPHACGGASSKDGAGDV